MFYLDKCERCDRYGSIAELETDKICNLCKYPSRTVTVKLTNKKEMDHDNKPDPNKN